MLQPHEGSSETVDVADHDATVRSFNPTRVRLKPATSTSKIR